MNHIKILKDLTTWEFKAKALINDINEKYKNHSKRKHIFTILEEDPEENEQLFKIVIDDKFCYQNRYKDDILDVILDRLENLNAKAQAYFNKLCYEKNEVAKAKALQGNAEVSILLILIIILCFTFLIC